MNKITFTDSYQNRTRKTKRWLGMLAFCMMLFGGQTAFAQIAQSYDFDDETLQGWVNTESASFYTNTNAPCSGTSVSVNFYIYDDPWWSAYYDTNTFTSPSLGTSDGTEVSMSFSYKVTDYGYPPTSDADADVFKIDVQWANSSSGPWTTFHTIDESNHTPSLSCAVENLTFTPGTGDLYVRFDSELLDDTADILIFLDDILISQGGSPCFPPSGLTASDISLTEATLGWTSDGDEFELEWGVQGFEQGSTDGTIVTGINTNSYELTVTEGGNYDFYVRQICDSGESTWAGPFSFHVFVLGDDCSAPITIDALPYTTIDDTANYSDNPNIEGSPGASGCGSTSSYLNGNDVVYSYTADSDGSVSVNLTEIGTYTGIFVYASCEDIGTACIGGNVNGYAGGPINFDLVVEEGETYYFVISTWASPQTTAYTLAITENTCTEHSATYTTVMSDCDAQEFSIEVNITDMGSAINLEVNDDQGSTSVMATSTGIVTMGPYTFGTPVVITIDNADDGNCSISSDSLTMNACPPANDNCSGAIELTVNSDLSCDVVTSGTTVAATQSMAASPCFGNPDDDVWFSFEATATSHQITISNVVAVEGTSTDMYFQVLSGTCDDFTSLLCSDPNQNTVSGLTVGDTYFVRVYSYYDTSRQTFDICVGTFPPPPANDECSGAEALTVGADFASANIPTSNAGATANSSDPLPTCDEYNFATNGKDIWFTVIVPASGEVTLETRGDGSNSITDTGLQAYSGTCGDLTSLGCNADDGEGNFSKLELVGLTAGETIYVRTWGYNGSFGSLLIAAYGDVDPCDGITPPEIESPQSLDEGQTLADVVVTAGENLTWYTDEDLTEAADTSEELTEGEYTFFVTQTVGDCTSEATEVLITVTLSLSDFDTTQLKVYPNPTNGELNISYTDIINQVEVYNLLGQKVITQNFESNNVSLNVSHLSNGSYILILHANDMKQQVKIIKN